MSLFFDKPNFANFLTCKYFLLQVHHVFLGDIERNKLVEKCKHKFNFLFLECLFSMSILDIIPFESQ